MPTPTETARTWIAEQIRSRVIGADADSKGSEIFAAPGPRWFDEGSPIKRVHSDASMFIGGLRALLLQSLHPLAMAGVAQHSDYRADPWGRLQRTADFVASTTFGPIDRAEQSIEVVRRVHNRVQGFAPDGRAYSANDPHLLHWVHIVEIDSFLAAHQRYGEAPLTTAEADEYVGQTALVARKLGVIDPPTSRADLRVHLHAFRPELRSSAAAREAARFLIIDPPLPLAARPAYFALSAAAVALLPTWTRWPLRVPLLPIGERFVIRPTGSAATNVIRWAMRWDDSAIPRG